jgi:hypothetical protein
LTSALSGCGPVFPEGVLGADAADLPWAGSTPSDHRRRPAGADAALARGSSAGRARLQSPDEADHSVELADRRVLALTGRRLTGPDTALLNVFVGQFRARGERAILDTLDTKGPA